MTVWLTAEERTAWLAYLRATQEVELTIGQQLRRSAGMTHPEYEILARLSAMPGKRLRVNALATAAVSPKSRLSYQLDRLESRGLIRRVENADDSRGIDAVVTNDGMTLLGEIAAGHVDTVRSALIDRLSPEEFIVLGRLMSKIAG